MKIVNKNSFELSPIFDYDYKNDFDPYNLLDEIFLNELYTSDTNNKVEIYDNNKNLIPRLEITDVFANCLDKTIEKKSEIFMNELFKESLTYKDNNTNLIDSVFVDQAAVKNNLPMPSKNIIYTYATDIIPTAKAYLNNEVNFETLFASFDFVNNLNILAFAFDNKDDFNLYKEYIKEEVSKINLSDEVKDLFKEFDKIKLENLTETIILREKIEDNNEPYSFPRILTSLSMNYCKKELKSNKNHIMPFSLRELLIPKTITFINIENHKNATVSKISSDWNDIKKGLSQNLKIINTKKINKLEPENELSKNMKKLMKNLKRKEENNLNANLEKKDYKIHATRTKTPHEYINIINNIMKRQANVNRSLNSYKEVKNSFKRANRRDPDDFNKQGKITSTLYRPDIHLYIDTSASIDEKHYSESVKLAILIAKKLNVDLYFNSFSHYVSNSVKLPIKNKSTKAVYNVFQNIPKVNGGTDFNNVWQYINKSKKRKKELALMITDFEYYVPNNKNIKIPDNLYYMPCSYMNFENIKFCAENFYEGASFLKKDIRKNILI